MTRAKARELIDAIERTPLAWPMALLMAGAAAFLAYTVPAAIVEQGVAAAGIDGLAARAVPFGPVARAVLALTVALIGGGAVWWLFDRLERAGRPDVADEDPDIDLFAPETNAAAPQLRRADAHPDAPARRPLFAASDLGAPLDAVEASTPFGRPPLFVDAQAADDDGDDVLLLDESYGIADADDEAPVPEPGSTPVSEDSIAGMMARLERGLERRGGTATVAIAADDPDGSLRQALDELRRMTIGR